MRSSFSVLALALALVSASCSSANTIASVNGEGIVLEDVSALLAQGEAAVDAGNFRDVLVHMISNRAILPALSDELGVEITEDEIEVQIDSLLGPSIDAGQTREEILAGAGLSEAGLSVIAIRGIWPGKVDESLPSESPDLSDEELMQIYDDNIRDLASVCSSHVIVDTEADAQAALDRAVGGEDFAAIAIDVSIGPSSENGGSLSCVPPSRFVPEFADALMAADVDVAYGPVESEFGWHVILVTTRTIPTLDETRDQLIAQIAAERRPEIVAAWITNTLEAADISVDEEIGIWTTDTSAILPPDTQP